MARLFSGPFFPYLERLLADELASVKRDDPFLPVGIIVPNRAVRRRLLSELAGRGSWINLHFFTFYTLARAVLTAAGGGYGPIPPRAALSALLKETIASSIAPSERTAYLLRYEGCLDRLSSLFSRFTTCRAGRPPRPTEMEDTLFALYDAFLKEKRARSALLADDLIAAAADRLASGIPDALPKTIFLYGFYDLNPLQRLITRRLDEKGTLSILAPGGLSGEAGEFAAKTAAFYAGLAPAGENPPIPDTPPDPESIPLIISRRLFSGETTSPIEANEAIRLVTASGTAGEAEAIALEIIHERERSPTLAWRDIGVTMRNLADFREALVEAFDRFSIPAAFDGGRPLSTDPGARFFSVMIDTLENDLPRGDVAFLISSAFFAWPGIPEADAAWVRENASLAELFARRYKIVSGKKAWDKAFARHEKDAPAAAEIDDEDDGRPDAGRRQAIARFVAAARPVITAFLDDLAVVPAEAPPEVYRDLLTSLVDTYIRPPDPDAPGIGRIKEIMTLLAAFHAGRGAVPLVEYLAMVRREINESTVPGPENADAVFVSDVMGTRGLSFEVLFLTGMNEGVFPAVGTGDPFLTDETQLTLGLPTAATRYLEDRTLFSLTVGAAQRLLVVTRQRSDDAGRILVPSPFLDELASRITIDGTPLDPSSPLSEGAGRDYPRLSASDRSLSRYRREECRLSLCLGWSPDAALPPIRAAVSHTPLLREGLLTVIGRAPDRPFSAYDGRIGPAPGLLEATLPLSSQKLETYAGCPFDFFMRYVLGTPEPEEVEEELDVEPRELGLMYHRVLSLLFATLVEKGLMLPDGTDDRVVEGLVKGYVTKEVSGRLRGRVPTLIVTAREWHAVEIIGRLVAAERRHALGGALPVRVEAVFGSREPDRGGGFTLTVGKRALPFVGRIDRIDVNEGEETFFVVDYKRKKAVGKRKLATDIERGRHFQIPLYLLAAGTLISGKGLSAGGGALVYLEWDDAKDSREVLTGTDYARVYDRFLEHVGETVAAVEGGDFVPRRDEGCTWCAWRDLCRSDIKAIGHARRARTETGKQQDREDEDDDDR